MIVPFGESSTARTNLYGRSQGFTCFVVFCSLPHHRQTNQRCPVAAYLAFKWLTSHNANKFPTFHDNQDPKALPERPVRSVNYATRHSYNTAAFLHVHVTPLCFVVVIIEMGRTVQESFRLFPLTPSTLSLFSNHLSAIQGYLLAILIHR